MAPRQRRRLLAARPDRHSLLDQPNLERFSGRVSDSGEGRWTILAAIESTAPHPF